MRLLRNGLVLLGAGFLVLMSAAVLAMSATNQMAAKRRISLEYRDHMEQCKNLSGDAAGMCEQQARGHADVAKAALIARRNAVARSPL